MTEQTRIEKVREAVQNLTDSEFEQHRTWCAIEEKDRRTKAQGERGVYILMREMGGGTVPDVWEPAKPPHLVWLPNDVASHEGVRYVNVLPIEEGLNVGVPGVSEWWQPAPEEVTTDDDGTA